MAKKLILNAMEPREIRAAIMDGDTPINFFIERSQKKFQKGNIYKARVTSIEPHLQAAFVELEKGQHGFLGLSDVIFPDGGVALCSGQKLDHWEEQEEPESSPAPKNQKSNKKDKSPKVSASEKDGNKKPAQLAETKQDENKGERESAASVPQAPKAVLAPSAGDMLLGDLEVPEKGDEDNQGAAIVSPLLILEDAESTEAPGTDDSSEASAAGAPETSAPVESAEAAKSPDAPESSASVESAEAAKSVDAPEALVAATDTESASDTDNPEELSIDSAVDTTVMDFAEGEEEYEDLDSLDEDASEQESSETDKAQASGSTEKNKNTPKPQRKGRIRRPRNTKIEDVLEVGQYILVQIIKEGIGKKAPMVSTYLSLAGHCVVLTPGNNKGGISKQIRSQEERSKFRKVLSQAKIPDYCGLIVRTAAEGVSEENLLADINNLSSEWISLQKEFVAKKAGGVLKKEEALLCRVIRDYYKNDIDEVWIDSKAAFEEVKEFFKGGMPDQVDRLRQYEGDTPIFNKYRLEESMRSLFRRKAPLPGGGSLVFDQCEAMLVIDVNSGTFKEGKDDDDTAFKLNMLACKEIAKQVQMRDVGGIVMIYFVDMRRISSRSKVERELEKSFRGDKAKINIMHIGPLGVLQMSRQRTGDSLRNALYATCPVCDGIGLVPSKKHTAVGILREIREYGPQFEKDTLKLATTPEAALELLNNYKKDLIAIEDDFSLELEIVADDK
ncbi:MAG: Rne/Rng family ribonuclease, partial [Planctomycetes bacterium]|nr:Rne/Rng family ribonuclease [Planctomycetota bacterium]